MTLRLARPCLALVAATVLTAALPLAAPHEITYKGTVISADAKAIKVTVVDEKTKKAEPMAFTYDKDTKILRGDKVVTFADARIQKDEKIAVTIDHDDNPDMAIVIRLDEKK